MDYLAMWFDRLTQEPGLALDKAQCARGECRRLGSNPWLAAVTIEIAPSNMIQVDSTLDQRVVQDLKAQGLYNQVLFGVLDEMLTYHPGPVKDFRLTLVEVEVDPVRTTPKAVRMAARDAASKILSEARVYPRLQKS